MKIVMLGSFFNHHQAPLSDALYAHTLGEFCFVETASMPSEQKALGYPRLDRTYVLPWAGNEELVLKEIREADAVIAGAAPQSLVRQRLKSGGLLLRYSERPLREGPEPWKYLPRLLRWHFWNPQLRPVYLLSAGAFTAGDYAKFGLFRGRAFQWGYFPDFLRYDLPTLFSRKDCTRILWCGRFLELKHPEAAIRAAYDLQRSGMDFTLTMVGTGPEEAAAKALAKQLGLENHIRFPGPLPAQQVREEMERSGIFLFTSDRREGWGVVVNEAMNSGCAVIASHAAGSVPCLIQNGKNGMIYPSGDQTVLNRLLRILLPMPEMQQQLGLAAYRTVRELWNPDTAARRLIILVEALLDGEDCSTLFPEGPCAPATELDEGWFA